MYKIYTYKKVDLEKVYPKKVRFKQTIKTLRQIKLDI